MLKTPPWEWPAGADKIILRTLVDKQAAESDRLIAAELGSELVVMNDSLADALLTIVTNGEESDDLRATAASSLGPVLEEAELSDFDDPDDVPIAENTFNYIRDFLHKLYLDESLSKDLRRRVLEAAVRAPEVWHADAIRTAYASGDNEWVLTAVFAMRWVRGFEDQILEALSTADPLIHFEAINAAGARELDAAWPHVVALVKSPSTSKDLLLAAIEAVGNIRPGEAGEILDDLLNSRDEEIAEAAHEAMAMAQVLSGESMDEEDDEEGDEEEGGKWVN